MCRLNNGKARKALVWVITKISDNISFGFVRINSMTVQL